MENKFLKYSILSFFIIFTIFIHYVAKKPQGAEIKSPFSSGGGRFITKGEKMKDFSLENLEGNTISLSDYTDKEPVILYFWRMNISCLEINDETIKKLETTIDEPEKLDTIKSLKNLKFSKEEMINRLFMSGLNNKEIELVLKDAHTVPICIESIRELEKFQEKYKEKVKVITINAGDVRLELEKFLKDNDYNIEVLTDRQNDIPRNYGIIGPTLIVLDKGGTILYIYEQSLTEEDFKKILNEKST